jgi:hypothetical protein
MTIVLVGPPTRAPSGRQYGWTTSHSPDCKWALSREARQPDFTYVRMPVRDVPSHVERCGHCGGGR